MGCQPPTQARHATQQFFLVVREWLCDVTCLTTAYETTPTLTSCWFVVMIPVRFSIEKNFDPLPETKNQWQNNLVYLLRMKNDRRAEFLKKSFCVISHWKASQLSRIFTFDMIKYHRVDTFVLVKGCHSTNLSVGRSQILYSENSKFLLREKRRQHST